jgi:bifunctional DNA-binding transcriptional regulator/antitoxin component of YhaV-PrlF toxin-antitoxin module
MEQTIVRKRKVVKLGSSLYSSIPYDFAKRHGIKPGDPIAITVNQELLKIIPFDHSKEEGEYHG